MLAHSRPTALNSCCWSRVSGARAYLLAFERGEVQTADGLTVAATIATQTVGPSRIAVILVNILHLRYGVLHLLFAKFPHEFQRQIRIPPFVLAVCESGGGILCDGQMHGAVAAIVSERVAERTMPEWQTRDY